MAGATTREPRFTRADFEKVPEDIRVELIRGRLLKMEPTTFEHQGLVGRLMSLLAKAAGEDHVVVGPIGFLVDDESILLPDAAAFATRPPRDAAYLEEALLVVEVLLPLTAERDRRVKTPIYLRAGVKEVWLVDPEGKTVEVSRRRGGRRFKGRQAAASRAVPGFRVVPAELFGK